MAAYGTDVFTTLDQNNYGTVNGTSFATPAVTGAAALLYAAPCRSFGDLLLEDPAGAARYVRDILLNSGRPLTSLAGETVTGRALDIGTAMESLVRACDDPVSTAYESVASPLTIYPNPATARIVVSWPERLRPLTLTVFSLTGQTLTERQLTSGQTRAELQTGDWPAGSYLLRLRDRNGDNHHRRLIRQQ